MIPKPLTYAKDSSASSSSAAAAAQIKKPAGATKSASSAAAGRKVEIVKFGSAHYTRVRIPCARVPLESGPAQDTKGKGSQLAGRKPDSSRTIHVPLDMNDENMARTCDELLKHNITTIDRVRVANTLKKAHSKAVAGVKAGGYVSPEGTEARSDKSPCSAMKTADLADLLYRHTGSRSRSPGRRREAVVMDGDLISRKNFPTQALDISVALAATPEKDQKSSSAAATGIAATPPRQPWEAEKRFISDSLKRQYSVSSWVSNRFFDHMMRTGREKAETLGTGHVRVTHDSNAWPRTWSLEKMAEVAAKALQTSLQSGGWQNRSGVFCARFEGLNVFVALRSGATDKIVAVSSSGDALSLAERRQNIEKIIQDSIVGAYVSRTTSARAKEREELGQAMNLLKQLGGPRARSIAATADNYELWSILGAAKALSLAKAKLSSTDEAIVTELEELLSIDGTRHPLHEERLGQDASNALARAGFQEEADKLDTDLERLSQLNRSRKVVAPVTKPALATPVGASSAAAAAKQTKPQDAKASTK